MKCLQTLPDLELLTDLTSFVNHDTRFLLKKPPAQKVSPTELQENVIQITPMLVLALCRSTSPIFGK